MKQLLLEGDVEGLYAGHNESEAGYRVTMALAVAASQSGREWSPADFHQALIYTPTAGGEWARLLRARKGPEYAEGKLTGMLLKAREFVADRPAISCRHSAWESVDRLRQAVERSPWPCRGGLDTDLKNLTVRLRECEKSGGLDHDISVRRLAEEMGCSKATAAASNRRIEEDGWLQLKLSGGGSDRASQWRLCLPEWAKQECAAPVHPSSADTRGGRSPVPVVHTDTRSLSQLIGHDAFHRYGHGTTGARLLTILDEAEGRTAKELTEVSGFHRTTVGRHLKLLLADGLVFELEDLFYLAPVLAGEVGVEADEEALNAAASQRGTRGAGHRRRKRHQKERLLYRAWRLLMRSLKAARGLADRGPLVPKGAVDRETGEIIDPAWRGWDVSDPDRPVPLPIWAVAA
ncbi:helix-turn-helix domain-containing protein [Streptomyces kronopolitis]|uniref:helix-turn-helix domain-containing protein n=1 Tax=Streptomyces kronopolitis TaxID=1612435 RepID=UPI003D961FDD